MGFVTAVARSTPRSSRGTFIAQKVVPATRAGVLAFATVAHQESQNNVRVKTGRLKASGTDQPFQGDEPGGIKIIETEKSVTALIIYSAFYASFLEFRFPFLRPALDTARDAGWDLFRGQVSAGLK